MRNIISCKMWINVLLHTVVIFVLTEGLSECSMCRNERGQFVECSTNGTKNCTMEFLNFSNKSLIHLPENAFGNLSSSQHIVSELTLNRCTIESIHVDAFMNLHNLTYLDLQVNEIVDVDIKTFQHIQQVEIINMNYNKIKKLKAGLFKNLRYLRKVALAGNHIFDIEKDTFQNTPSLYYINIQNNALQNLDISFKQNLSSITQFYLHENPWNCDYKLLELYKFFITLGQSITYTPRCKYPVELREQVWKRGYFYRPQIIKPTNEDKWITVGSTFNLSCVVFGFPKSVIYWLNGTTVIATDHLPYNPNTYEHYVNYTFTAEKYDTGKYYCVIENQYGKQEAYLTLYVDDVAFPWMYIGIKLALIIVIINGTAIVVIFTVRKYKRKREVLLPSILKRLSWWRGRPIQMRRIEPEISDDESPIINLSRTPHHFYIREAARN